MFAKTVWRLSALPPRIKGSGREDLITFLRNNQAAIEYIREKNKTPVKGYKHYAAKTVENAAKFRGWVATRASRIYQTDWASWAKETFRFSTPEEKAAKKAKKEANRIESSKQMAKFYVARDVQGTLVCKQVFFEDGCKMTEFADRMRDAEVLFRRLPPFADLTLKVVPDTSVPSSPTNASSPGSGGDSATESASSSASSSSAANTADPKIQFNESDFNVIVKDSCTPKELYEFLEREARQVQVAQRAWSEEQDRVRKVVLDAMKDLKLSDVRYNMQLGGETGGDITGVLEQLTQCPVYLRKHLEGLVVRIKANQDTLEFDLENENLLIVPSRLYRPLVLHIPLGYRLLQLLHLALRKSRYVLYLVFLTVLGESELI